RRSTPRSTRTRCVRWRARGRWERGHDRAAARRRGLSGDAAGAGVQADHPSSATDVVRRLLPVPRQRPDHQRAGAAMGDNDSQRQQPRRLSGAAADDGTDLRPPLPDPGPDSEIPPEDALPHHRCRIAPHLYSTGEISALIDAAGRLRPPLRAATWQTLIGLLTVTGMRKSEACRLDDEHVDLDAATLVVLDSKFGKS